MARTTVTRTHHMIDAQGLVLGRLASDIAMKLRGKNKPSFQPHLDLGDSVTVTNVAEIKLTGQKINQKVYHRYSGYPGGLKTEKIAHVMKKDPARVLRNAVKNMLPDNRLRTGMLKRLHIEK